MGLTQDTRGSTSARRQEEPTTTLYTLLWTESLRWPVQPQVGGFLGILWTADQRMVAEGMPSFACGA